MRFMMLVKMSEAVAPPSRELIEAIGALAQKRTASGHLLDSAGLARSSAGARIRLSKGKLAVFDGPFAETTEVFGGYAIMKAADRAEAIALGRELVQVHADVLGDGCEMELEIRQMVDGPPDVV